MNVKRLDELQNRGNLLGFLLDGDPAERQFQFSHPRAYHMESAYSAAAVEGSAKSFAIDDDNFAGHFRDKILGDLRDALTERLRVDRFEDRG